MVSDPARYFTVCGLALLAVVLFGNSAAGYGHKVCSPGAVSHLIDRFFADHAEEGAVRVDFEKPERGLVEARPGAQVYYDYVIRLRITYDETTEDEIGAFSLWTVYYTRSVIPGFCWVHGTSEYVRPTPLYNPDRW